MPESLGREALAVSIYVPLLGDLGTVDGRELDILAPESFRRQSLSLDLLGTRS